MISAILQMYFGNESNRIELMAKPVTLITGFLGAGKTTFLNALLQSRPGVRYAIIENEYGEENIDADLLMRADDDLISMSNGCLCCTLNDNLYDLLNELWQRRDEFDELLVETTGIADPAGVAMPFLATPNIKRDFPLARVICLIDPNFIEDRLRDTEEAARQIAFSDVILLSKTDTVGAPELADVQQKLAAINPFARVLSGHKGAFPIEAIMACSREATLPPALPAGLAGRKQHHHHHQHSDIVSLSFRFDEPFDLPTLRHRLMGFLLFQAEGIYRVKGIFYAAQMERKIILQSVSTTLTVDEGEPWAEGEARISRVVFIGRRLRPEGFERMLRQCLK